MQEVELTAQRLLSVWWLIMWRGLVDGVIIGGIAGGIAGFAVGILGYSELGAVVGGYAGLAIAPFWGLFIVLMALKKNYRGFRVALVSR